MSCNIIVSRREEKICRTPSGQSHVHQMIIRMVNVTGIFNPEINDWQFQELWALMFGYASGVVNFNR